MTLHRLNSIRSLRGLLLREVALALVLIWLAASGFILVRTWAEVQDAYRDQVEQVAHVLTSVLDPSTLTQDQVFSTLPAFRDRNYAVLILSEGEVVMRTARADDLEEDPEDLYSHRETSRSGQIEVIVGLLREEPLELVASVGLGAAAPLLLGFLVTLGLIWRALGRGLRPLNALRLQLAMRQPEALTHLDVSTIPDELRPVIAALNDLLTRLDNALAAERRFVADASHELRTPLTAIRAQLDTIDQTRLDPHTKEAMARVVAGANRASRLVGQLLSLARADTMQSVPAQLIETSSILSELAAELYPQAVRAGKELELELCHAYVRVKREDLEMMAGNLLENAICHARHLVRLSSRIEKDWLVLRIEDDGQGVAEADKAVIFERFRRGSLSADQGGGSMPGSLARGAGLGLSIVASIVQRNKADLHLENRSTGGLCVTVRLARVEKRYPSQPMV